MKLLLTAFDPFGGSPINPALEAVKLVADKIGDVEIVKLEVPTVFGKSVATVAAKMAEVKPDAVLCIGQAGGRYDLTPERVAINLDDARIQDNEGQQPIDVAIFEDGAPAYFSNLPIKAMVAKIREVGLPASVSNTAGTFVCNHLMYGVLYHIAKSYPGVKGGFMHVPFVPSQTVNRPTPAPSMCEQDIARGIEAAIAAIAEKVLNSELPRPLALNVNIPKLPLEQIKGLKVCRQTRGFWRDHFFKHTDPHGRDYYWLTGGFENFEPEAEDTDEWALANGYVAVVPVQVDLTAYNQIDILSKTL